jgi:hypothetical protein
MPAGHQSDGTAVILVITETYDQANGWMNDWGRYFSGRDQQMIMWEKYHQGEVAPGMAEVGVKVL